MGNSSKVNLGLVLSDRQCTDIAGCTGCGNPDLSRISRHTEKELPEIIKLKIKNLEDKEMKEFKYVVTDNEGIHARPAGELVKLVKGFESKITIEKDGKTVECRKLLALMGLGVKKGHEVTFTFDGADEDAAYEAVSKFMQENL